MRKDNHRDAWAVRYGRWALITGASDGIGRAMATECARRGLNVMLVARRGEALSALAAVLIAEHGIAAQCVPADLSLPADVARLIAAAATVDIGLLIAAAGFGTAGRFVDIDPAEEQAMLAVNCAAVLALTAHVAPRLAARGRGGIVLFGSIVGFQGVAGAATYAATKAFNQLLAEGLARELSAVGVHVIACAPGPVATGFAARSRLALGGAADAGVVARETLSALGRWTVVRPGLRAKLLIHGLALLPRALRSAIMGAIMAGMIADYQKTTAPG